MLAAFSAWWGKTKKSSEASYSRADEGNEARLSVRPCAVKCYNIQVYYNAPGTAPGPAGG